MRKILRCSIGILFLSIILSPLMIYAAPAGNFTYIKGQIDITSPGQEARPATLGMEVFQGDTIRSKSDSKAEITFIDGNILRLAPGTRIEINEYISNQEQTSAILKLFRGKVQNQVRGLLGAIFGMREKNRFEVHTPTAVCGVRGTDFFTWYIKGESGSAFKEGTGYGYSMNVPDDVKEINTGQAMIVISPDKPPRIKPATDIELQQHLEDTAPTEETAEEEEETEEGVSEEGAAAEEKTTAEEETAEVAEEDITEQISEIITEDPDVSVEELEADEAIDTLAGTGTSSGTVTDQLSVTTGGNVETPEVEVYEEETGDFTLFSGPFQVGFLTEGTLTGSIDNLTNNGTIGITGTFSGSPSGPDSGPISGPMGGGAFSGETALVIGSLNGTFASLYLEGGTMVGMECEGYPYYWLENPGIGYLYGAYSGTLDTVNGVLSAGGGAYRSGTLGTVDYIDIYSCSEGTPGEALAESFTCQMTSFGFPVPELGAINAGGNFTEGVYSPVVTERGIETTSGRRLGIWSSTTTGGLYQNDPDMDPATPGLPTWHGVYGETDFSSYPSGFSESMPLVQTGSSYYLLGSLTGTDDMAGHLSVNGSLDYLDSEYQGTVYLWNRGVYDTGSGSYKSAGTGTFTLDPLIISGWTEGNLVYYDHMSYPSYLWTDSYSFGMLGATAYAYPQLTIMGGFTAPTIDDPLLSMGMVGGTSLDPTLTACDEFYGYQIGAARDDKLDGRVRSLAIKEQDGTYLARSLAGTTNGYTYSGINMFAATSVLTPDTRFDNTTSVAPASLMYSTTNESFSGYYGSGKFGAGGTLELFTTNGNSMRISDQDWGIWSAGFGGIYSGSVSDSWNLAIGGDYYGSYGYWLGHIAGTSWGDPDIFGNYRGTALTDTHYYEFDADAIMGTRKETGASGDWQAAGIGTYTIQALTLNGFVNEMYDDGFAYWDTGITPYPELTTYPGTFYGNIGSPYSLFTGFNSAYSTYASIPFTGMGYYCAGTVAESDPALFVTDIYGYLNNAVNGDISSSNGYYSARMGGTRTGNSMDARLVGLYTVPEDSLGTYEAGFITSNMLDITLYPGAHIWEIPLDGYTLTATRMGTGLSSEPVYSYGMPWYEPALIGGDITGYSWVDSASFYVDGMEQPWGTWTADSGGSHSGAITAPWQAVMGWTEPPSSYMPGWKNTYNIVHLNGTSSANGRTYGIASGQALLPDDNYLMQVEGDILGAYNNTSWESVAIGTWKAQSLYASSGFYGNLLRMTPGTLYEGRFQEQYEDTDPYYPNTYDYSYLLQEGTSKLLYGERWEEYPMYGEEFGEIFLPTGRYPDYGSQIWVCREPFFEFSFDGWDVGSQSEDYFPPMEGGSWYPTWFGEEDSNILIMSGTLDGALGIVGDPVEASSSSPAGLVLMGNYNPIDPITLSPAPYGDPYLFGMSFGQTSDPSLTHLDYQGFIGGVIDDVTGNGYALYISGESPPYSSGVFDLRFSGPTYPEIKMWEATGSIYPVLDKGTIDIAPQDMQANIVEEEIFGWLEGDFGYQDSKIFSDLAWGSTLSILGHDDWGIYELLFGHGNFAENPGNATSFSARVGGVGEFGQIGLTGEPDTGYYLTDPFTGTLNNGTVTVDNLTGEILTLSKYADIYGRAVGSYDTTDESWQAFASGYWDNGQPLNFNGILDGGHALMTKQYHGYGDDSVSSASFSYNYESVTNWGWSYYSNTSAGTVTETQYYPDGTKETWIRDYSSGEVLDRSDGTWNTSGSLLALLQETGLAYELEYYNWRDDPNYSEYYPYYEMRKEGSVEGLLGGLSDLWDKAYEGTSSTPGSGATVTLMGEASFWYEDTHSSIPSLFSTKVWSYNPSDYSHTIMCPDTYLPNGAYSGFISGRTTPGSILIDGNILGLAVDPEGNGGFVKGNMAGEVYSGDLEMWVASGSMFPILLPPLTSSVTGYSGGTALPDNLIIKLNDTPDYYYSSLNYQSSTGIFRDVNGDITGNINVYNGQKWDQFIGGENLSSGNPWSLGVHSSVIGGNYEGTISDSFGIPTREFLYDDMYYTNSDITIRQSVLAGDSITGSKGSWSNNLIEGVATGAWMHIEDTVAFTGVAGGDIKGTFDPNHSTWQVSSLLASMDTNTFLALQGTMEGRNQLALLNIPYVKLGEANLTGSRSFSEGAMDVNMNNVKFFSYSDGTAPRLWATSNVQGSYEGTPMGYDGYTGSAGRWVVPLTGTNISSTSGLSADFMVQIWDEANGKWVANVNNGAGQVNSVSIGFGGGAAGTIETTDSVIDSSLAGSFSGTASGIAGPPQDSNGRD